MIACLNIFYMKSYFDMASCVIFYATLPYLLYGLGLSTIEISSFFRVDSPAQYQEGYGKLRSWAYNSLDQYQVIAVLLTNILHIALPWDFTQMCPLWSLYSTSWFACYIQYLSMVLWIWWPRVIFKKVYLFKNLFCFLFF